MKCYYEQLGVERDSTDAEIKSAYRKQALRWHPDKNPNAEAEAKERFQLIQQAYEVLADEHERAWYDKHREQILRGKNSEYKDNCLDVFQYFGTCYKGFGDDAKSFYSVYRNVFQKIASEDIEFMENSDELRDIPQFGNSESSYEEVVGPFYAFWQAYCTKRTYEWLCPYDVKEIKDRYVLRKVEKEMKKITEIARKERNEEVRNLVSFVRKRDRRVQANSLLLRARAEANRVKQEEKRQEQLRKRKEVLAEVSKSNVFNEGYEEQLKQLEQQYRGDSDDTDEDEADSDENTDSETNVEEGYTEVDFNDDLYCVACNKFFKNANARANHDESKKHKENLDRLCAEMQAEDQDLNQSNELEEGDISDPSEQDDLYCAACDKFFNNRKARDKHEQSKKHKENVARLETEMQSDNDTSNQANKSEESEEDSVAQPLHELKLSSSQLDKAGVSDADEDCIEAQAANKRSKKSKKSKKVAAKHLEDDSDVEDVNEKLESPKIPVQSDTDDDWGNDKKAGKKKSKNKKPPNSQKLKPEMKSPLSVESAVAASLKVEEDQKQPHTCVTCKATFDSKNKLFAHLKKTNHGVYIPKEKPFVEGKPPGKSKAKRK